jgi:hypothetical protein
VARRIVQCDEPGLIAYLAANSGARLVLRDVADVHAACAALRAAAAAVCEIPHPDEPQMPLPNWCEAKRENGLAILHLDIQDWGEVYGRQITEVIVAAIEAEDVAGRLEPYPYPGQPLTPDPARDVPGVEYEPLEFGDRGLPPGLPGGFPAPGGQGVYAWRIRQPQTGELGAVCAVWEHDGQPPFDAYLDLLRAFGCELDRVKQDSEPMGGMRSCWFLHEQGTGYALAFHDLTRVLAGVPGAPKQARPSAWYLSVMWKPESMDSGTAPEP